MDTQQHFSLVELSTLSGTPVRTIRWYIEHKLVDRPEGQNRGAYYLNKHLEQLLTIKKWQEAGLSLDRIRSILNGEQVENLPTPKAGTVKVLSHVFVTNGVYLVIDPSETSLTTDGIRKLVTHILAYLSQDKSDT